jgi:hypothetical protein
VGAGGVRRKAPGDEGAEPHTTTSKALAEGLGVTIAMVLGGGAAETRVKG